MNELVRLMLRPALVAFALAVVLAWDIGAQDTLVVVADGEPVWGPSPGLVEELRIGALEGPPEQTFGRVAAIAVAPDHTLAIADIQVPIVRLYGPDGAWIGNAGREGEGPGEYRTLLGLQPYPDGGFAVWDPANGRVSVYTSGGEFRSSVRVASGLHTAEAFQVDTAGNFYVKASGALDPVTQTPVRGWLELSPDGDVLAVVPMPDAAPDGPDVQISSTEGPLRPFTVRTHAAVSPLGHRIVGRSDAYRLSVSMADGAVLTFERPHETVVLEPEEREQWERWLAFVEKMAGRSFGRLPNRKPAFHDFTTDVEGRIWVRRHARAVEGPDALPSASERPSLTWREPPTYDVLGPDGRFLGTVVLPSDTRLRASRGMHVWVTQHGEFGETYIVRYRIELRAPAPRIP